MNCCELNWFKRDAGHHVNRLCFWAKGSCLGSTGATTRLRINLCVGDVPDDLRDVCRMR